MARLTRRGFVKVSGVLAAPALTAFSLRAQGQAPDTGNLRVEKDIVFGKGGGKDLTLDVYRPPAGVTSKRTAIVHLFGGGFFVGNKNAGYIINDAKALGARGYTNISANYRLQQRESVAGADSGHEGRDPLDPRERRPPRRRSQPDRGCRLLGRRNAVAHGRRQRTGGRSSRAMAATRA